MNIKVRLYHFIEQLSEENQYYNIFYEHKQDELLLGDTVIDFFVQNQEELYEELQNLDDQSISVMTRQLAKLSSERLLKTLTKVNQYMQVDDELKTKVNQLYVSIIYKLMIQIQRNSLTTDWLYSEVYNHQSNLKMILKNYDELTLFKNKSKFIEHIPNFEYTPELQLKLMGINIHHLVEPILDLGCGEHAHLVSYLANLGFQVIGIDRNTINSEYTIKTSWSDYHFGHERFGTIISHQSFSNHFKRQHFKPNGNIIEFSRLYIKILNSLKVNGSFYYAPNLPFIEPLLSKEQYQVENIPIEHSNFNAVRITKRYNNINN